MIVEKERTGRGYTVAEDPFAQNLASLAESRGFLRQAALARALGVTKLSVNQWYKGWRIPNPDHRGSLLVILKPNDQETDALIDVYIPRFEDY